MFTKEDFPTFDLPMNANSGKPDSGPDLKSVVLLMNVAVRTIMRVSCVSGKTEK